MQEAVLPSLDSWRNKLLLQALRETGEEMKRRRQTLSEVLARHAAEAAEDGSNFSGGSLSRYAGGGGGRKSGLSRCVLIKVFFSKS